MTQGSSLPGPLPSGGSRVQLPCWENPQKFAKAPPAGQSFLLTSLFPALPVQPRAPAGIRGRQAETLQTPQETPAEPPPPRVWGFAAHTSGRRCWRGCLPSPFPSLSHPSCGFTKGSRAQGLVQTTQPSPPCARAASLLPCEKGPARQGRIPC